MQRILIVEDNKTLAKLMSKKISEELSFEVDIAYNLHEAKLFLRLHTYFLTLLDLNLPDAPNGEIVDYVLKQGNKAIVLSANVDKDFRKKILEKNIIDYVNKNGVDDINYIIQNITRLQKNQKHTVLVVDASMVFRKKMKNMLDTLFFNVITVAHGEEALGILQTNSNISLVITDYNMPVMDGLELTYEIRKTYKKDSLSIIALSSNEDDAINAMFLKNGANDYIKKPFSKEEFSCRINNTVESLENLNIALTHANRDFLTGLYNKRYFFKAMNEYIEDVSQTAEKFAVALIDIDHFKHINDTYSHDMGDKVIIHLSEILTSTTNYRDMIARFGGQEFCIVLKNVNRYSAYDILDRLRAEVEKTALFTQKNKEIRFTISIGVAMSSDENLESLVDQADMALFKAKNDGRNMLVLD